MSLEEKTCHYIWLIYLINEKLPKRSVVNNFYYDSLKSHLNASEPYLLIISIGSG